MKKLFFYISFLLIFTLLFTACEKQSYAISICVDRSSYDLTSSSVQGIRMIPEFKSSEKNLEVQYHWSTTEGGFISTNNNSTNKEIVNKGEALLWTAITDKSTKAPFSTVVKLEVEDIKTNKVLTETSLTIEGKDAVYSIRE